MKLILLTIYLLYVTNLWSQNIDKSDFYRKLYIQNDTLYMVSSKMPFNGFLIEDNTNESHYTLYQDGQIFIDSPFSVSDKRQYWAQMIFPLERDTFAIDIRYTISPLTFSKKKIFFLENVYGKSSFINIDTLKVSRYSQIPIPDLAYYDFYEKNRRCPFGNHRDSIVPYFYGLPNEKVEKLIQQNKIILETDAGSGEFGKMYHCKQHNIDF